MPCQSVSRSSIANIVVGTVLLAGTIVGVALMARKAHTLQKASIVTSEMPKSSMWTYSAILLGTLGAGPGLALLTSGLVVGLDKARNRPSSNLTLRSASRININ